MSRIYYKDIVTGNTHYTKGKPVGIIKGGPVNCRYLVISRKASELYIPEYLLIDRSIMETVEEIG